MPKPLVGILISEPAKPVFWGIYHYIIDVIDKELRKHNFKAVHINFHYNFEEAYQQCHSLLEQNVKGIIFNSVSSEYDYSVNKKIVEIFERQRIPVILIDKYFLNEPQNYSFITSDNYNGGFLATEHLIRLGHRRIAHIRYADSSSAQLREQGYRSALFKAGIRADENLIKGFFVLPQLFQILDSFFKSQIDRPSAIFTINDLVAHEVYNYLSQIDLRIPEDVAIVGFDDLPNAEKFDPPLTTVKQDFVAMGKTAVAYLLRRIEKFTQLPQAITPCELIVRESCGSKLKRNVSIYRRVTTQDFSVPVLNDSQKPKNENQIGILYGQQEKFSYIARNFSKIIEGIENTLIQYEYQLEYSLPFITKNEEYVALRELIRRQVSGLIILSTYNNRPFAQEALFFLCRRDIPFVIIGQHESSNLPIISVDDLHGGFLAAEYLIQINRKHLAIILAPETDLSSTQRLRGCHDALDQYHFKSTEVRVYRDVLKPGFNYFEAAYLWAISINSDEYPLDGLICFNDEMARGAIKAFLETGFKVPEDIAVVGFDDNPAEKSDQIPLTTIQVPFRKMGQEAAELIIKQINEKPINYPIFLKPELIIRQSA